SLESLLTNALSRLVRHRVMRRQVGIRIRIPLPDIDTVWNPSEPISETSQHTIQPKAKFWCQDFSCVSRTDRGQRIGEDNSSLEEVHGAVKLQRTWGIQRRVKAGSRESGPREKTLIAQIVEGQNNPSTLCVAPLSFDRLEVDGAECRLPVVKMENIGLPAVLFLEKCHPLENRTTEICKSIEIIRVVDPLLLIESHAIEEGIMA